MSSEDIDVTNDSETQYNVSCLAESSKEKPSVRMYARMCRDLTDTYRRKNMDYGDSFHRSVKKYGLIAALTRISDKFNRIENLILKGGQSNYESLSDTLKDLASYCIMSAMEIEDSADFEKAE